MLHNPPEDVTDHRFLQFPQTLNDATRARYVTNLSLLLTKEIDIAPSFDWELATRTGLAALIQEFLQYTHSDASGVELFVCQGWARLFRIQEPVYREFLLEFYATVSYDPRKPLDDRTAFAFRLGGVSRECSVIELATRVGIYTADETRSVHFPAFLADCLTERPTDYNENTFWAEITGGVYTPSTARGGMIRSTTYRMLHRLISMSLTHHKNSERVPSTDLYFLWALVTPGRHLNLPVALAAYLGRRARGLRGDSPICGGHFITRLARSYQLMTREITRSMVFHDMRPMSLQLLESMRVLERGGDGVLRDRADYEGAAEPQPRRVQRRRPAPRGAQQGPEREIDMRYLAQGIDRLSEYVAHVDRQQQWYGNALNAFFAHQGFQYSVPFPPPFQSRFDGAGTSGTQPHDDGDDE